MTACTQQTNLVCGSHYIKATTKDNPVVLDSPSIFKDVTTFFYLRRLNLVLCFVIALNSNLFVYCDVESIHKKEDEPSSDIFNSLLLLSLSLALSSKLPIGIYY